MRARPAQGRRGRRRSAARSRYRRPGKPSRYARSLPRVDAVSPLERGTGRVPEHRLTRHRHRRPAERQQLIMELAPRALATACLSPVLAQLADHQLAERVVEVARIVGPARGLLACVARVLEGLVAEHALAFPDLHALRMHADRADVADVAVERLVDPADAVLGAP